MRTAVAVILIFAFLVATVLVAFRPTLDRHEWTEQEIYVQWGDTLYGYACRYCPADVDREEWMEAVRDINGMRSSTLYAGDRITVIVAAEK